MPPSATGARSRSPNASQSCGSSQRSRKSSCGTWSRIYSTTTTTTVADIAAIGTSVSVETSRPTAATAASAAATYADTARVRSRPSANGTVVPDSSVTSPTGNSRAPVTTPTTAMSSVAIAAYTTMDTYLTQSNRVRSTGVVSR